MFTHKTGMSRFHDPYTVVVDLRTMKMIAGDPRGKFADIGQLVSACKSLPD